MRDVRAIIMHVRLRFARCVLVSSYCHESIQCSYIQPTTVYAQIDESLDYNVVPGGQGPWAECFREEKIGHLNRESTCVCIM